MILKVGVYLRGEALLLGNKKLYKSILQACCLGILILVKFKHNLSVHAHHDKACC